MANESDTSSNDDRPDTPITTNCTNDKSEANGETASNSVVSELVKLVKEEMYMLGIGCISLICSTMSNACVPKALGKVIDNKSCKSSLFADIPLFLILGGGLSSFIRTFTLNKVSHNIEYKLRLRLFESIMYSKDRASTSKSLVVMNEDIPEVSKMITTTSANILRNLSSITYSSYNMLQIDPTLCIASISIIPIIGSSAVVFLKILSKLKKKLKSNMLQCNEFWEERFNLLYTIQFYNRQNFEIQKCNDLLRNHQGLGVKYSLCYGAFMGSMFVSTSLALLGVVSFGINRVQNTRLSSGNFTSFATYSMLLGLGTTGFLDTVSKLRHGYDSAKRVFEVIFDAKAMQQSHKTYCITNPSSIVLNDVSYTYPDTISPAISNINLTLQKGKSYAIVGKNGVGKSTLVNLLAGSLQPTHGSITLDDGTQIINLHDLNPHTQRQYIGIIPQSPHLFNTTIYNNIIYSKADASTAEVTKLVKLCNVQDIGGDIGKNGCNVSGGQRQRIALARVLLHNPQLLFILDEPMNNLDNDGIDMLLSDVLLRESRCDAAVVLVTHNKECLKNVDHIIVLGHGGTVIANGTWMELDKSTILDEAM